MDINDRSNVDCVTDEEVKSNCDEGLSNDEEAQSSHCESTECRNCKILTSQLKSARIKIEKLKAHKAKKVQQQEEVKKKSPARRPRLDIGRIMLILPISHDMHKKERDNPERLPTWTWFFYTVLYAFLNGTYQYVETFRDRSKLWNEEHPDEQIAVANLPSIPIEELAAQLLPVLKELPECEMPDQLNLLRNLRNAVMHGSFQIHGRGGSADPRVFEFVDDRNGTGGVGATCDGNLIQMWLHAGLRSYLVKLGEWALNLSDAEFTNTFNTSVGTTRDHVSSWFNRIRGVPDHTYYLSAVLNLMQTRSIGYEAAKFQHTEDSVLYIMQTRNISYEDAEFQHAFENAFGISSVLL